MVQRADPGRVDERDPAALVRLPVADQPRDHDVDRLAVGELAIGDAHVERVASHLGGAGRPGKGAARRDRGARGHRARGSIGEREGERVAGVGIARGRGEGELGAGLGGLVADRVEHGGGVGGGERVADDPGRAARQRAVGCRRDGVVRRRASTVVEPPAPEQARSRRQLLAHGRLDLRPAACDAPDARLVEDAAEEAGRRPWCSRGRQRAPEGRVLDRGRLRREVPDIHGSVELTVQVERPNPAGVRRRCVMPRPGRSNEDSCCCQRRMIAAVRGVLEVRDELVRGGIEPEEVVHVQVRRRFPLAASLRDERERAVVGEPVRSGSHRRAWPGSFEPGLEREDGRAERTRRRSERHVVVTAVEDETGQRCARCRRPLGRGLVVRRVDGRDGVVVRRPVRHRRVRVARRRERRVAIQRCTRGRNTRRSPAVDVVADEIGLAVRRPVERHVRIRSDGTHAGRWARWRRVLRERVLAGYPRWGVDESACDGTCSAVGDSCRGGPLVEPPTPDETGTARELVVLRVADLLPRASDIPDARFVDSAVEESACGSGRGQRAADCGSLDGVRAGREGLREGLCRIESTVEIEPPGLAVVGDSRVVPDVRRDRGGTDERVVVGVGSDGCRVFEVDCQSVADLVDPEEVVEIDVRVLPFAATLGDQRDRVEQATAAGRRGRRRRAPGRVGPVEPDLEREHGCVELVADAAWVRRGSPQPDVLSRPVERERVVRRGRRRTADAERAHGDRREPENRRQGAAACFRSPRSVPQIQAALPRSNVRVTLCRSAQVSRRGQARRVAALSTSASPPRRQLSDSLTHPHTHRAG